jgi:hypothetical protein
MYRLQGEGRLRSVRQCVICCCQFPVLLPQHCKIRQTLHASVATMTGCHCCCCWCCSALLDLLSSLQGNAWQQSNLIGAKGPLSSWCAQYEWNCAKGNCGEGTACTASPAVQLQEGQPLLLAAKHWNGASIGFWQVGGLIAVLCHVLTACSNWVVSFRCKMVHWSSM